jgi:hypothetical protein
MSLRSSLLVVPALFALLANGCHSGPRGTYADTTGSMSLEFKGGGKASLTFLNKTADCTYASANTQVTVKCSQEADPMVFTVQKDGSLTGPPGGFMPPLKKK